MKRLNLATLIQTIAKAVKAEQAHQAHQAQINDNKENDEHIIYEYVSKAESPEIIITRVANNEWSVSGKTIAVLHQKNPLNNYQNILLFKIKLQDLGVYDELRKLGIKKGDRVKIFTYDLIWETE